MKQCAAAYDEFHFSEEEVFLAPDFVMLANENIQMLKRVGGNSHLQFSECVVTAIGFCLAR